MSALVDELDRYLIIRRSLGYALNTDERICDDLSPSRNRIVPNESAPLSSCVGRRHSATRAARRGRGGWA